ncbi:hypothetical protein KFL_003800060 [Klebsormidium nitens]|uniref:MYND-type domain-containing protein n=1 Tax=Klebsormidium nitens TaxID=105231 RepID=A0A1Y1IA84_KLENI|nr:hypothetical protein KFL_003800060 [Klebsormidium nitens]|eukprot:GAQ87830.1 hypothetical protein KFL_003800060 [Klebsormidium nitens]
MAPGKKHRPKVSKEVVAWEREPDFDTRVKTVPVDFPEFQLALSKYPQCELERNREIVRRALSDSEQPHWLPDTYMLVKFRWENPICQYCRRKPRIPRRETDVRLKKCTACHLVWYCSKECQKADWVKAHKQWCTNLPNVTEVDPTCPYKMAVGLAEVPNDNSSAGGRTGTIMAWIPEGGTSKDIRTRR